MPQNILKFDIISAIEASARKLPSHEINEYRIRTKNELEKLLKVKSNISKNELDTIQSLKREISGKILPADKGDTTVILDRDSYSAKINALINTDNYTKLKTEYREGSNLTLHYSKAPHFYGLPKIHK